MIKYLKNVSGAVLRLPAIHMKFPVDYVWQIPYAEMDVVMTSLDTLTAIRNGNLQVGWSDTNFFSDPTEGEAYLKSTFTGITTVIDGTTITEYIPTVVTDPETGKKTTSVYFEILRMMRELYNEASNPLFQAGFETVLDKLTSLTNTINLIQGDVGDNGVAIVELQDAISDSTAIIEAVQYDVAQNTAAIATNATNISDNTSDITSLQGIVSQNSTDITQLQSDVAENTSDITDTTAIIETLQADVAQNTSDITSLTSDISTLQADVSQNASDISDLQGDITALDSAIADSTAVIESVQSDVAQNTSDISALQTSVASNTTNISANTSDISDLQSDVASLQDPKTHLERPHDLLIYYGWLNSFNSDVNGWNNEKVAQDMARYNVIVLGDGIQDSGHGDYANTTVIIPRVKALNPNALIFGYVTVNQTLSGFQTKASQWDDLEIDGIFMDEAGYDYGTTTTNSRDAFNDRVDYVHGLNYATRCFANAWNMDHIIGTENDASYPNTTWNPSLEASNLNENDWYLLESFAVNTAAYTSSTPAGYEAATDWFIRGTKAVAHRDYYDINIASVAVIDNTNTNAADFFDFAFTAGLMFSLDAVGSSDISYGAGTAKVVMWNRPDISGMGRVWTKKPNVLSDLTDADAYIRFTDFGKMSVDFTSNAQDSEIVKN